ncbi:hypothetical protein NLJ89_g4954 [Agrocybe chaxingu]|uniref:NADP-dependent oxidoreductase domain-containing protein n=1 Tax=Agrocybe chaxingu TaxID=84603 RepID=A0A9W8MVG6_9AGAR|nr:hypothetical protein NLJ89_g4954 [Agrocybe chaxingu]
MKFSAINVTVFCCAALSIAVPLMHTVEIDNLAERSYDIDKIDARELYTLFARVGKFHVAEPSTKMAAHAFIDKAKQGGQLVEQPANAQGQHKVAVQLNNVKKGQPSMVGQVAIHGGAEPSGGRVAKSLKHSVTTGKETHINHPGSKAAQDVAAQKAKQQAKAGKKQRVWQRYRTPERLLRRLPAGRVRHARAGDGRETQLASKPVSQTTSKKEEMAIPTRKIGDDEVPAIGLGLMGISVFYGAIESDEERFKVLDAALEEGCTFWDTADIYGDSEELIGKWFKRTGNRDKIFLATKFGITQSAPNGKPEYVRSACELSLKKLGVNTIDLYYIHRIDQTIPIETTMKALVELKKEGKIRYIGLSEASAATLRRAHAVHPVAATQVEYSPFVLDIEDEKIGVLKVCRELGIAVIAYSPLGRGMLTGTYRSFNDIPEDDIRRWFPRFSDKNFPNINKLVDGLQGLGKKHNSTAGQVTLAWLLAQGNDIIPIPGTKKIKYVKENMAAAKIDLSREEVAEVRKIANDADATDGDRYPNPDLMAQLFADTPALA